MPVVNYYSVNGFLKSENGASGRLDYGIDALGSVVATMNSSGAAQNQYRYKPYGAVLSQSGSGTQPAFGWSGALGYRPTGLTHSDVYVRARHYGTLEGRWTSVDPAPGQTPYAYAQSNPTSLSDVTGLDAIRVQFDAFISKNSGFYLGQQSLRNPKCYASYYFGQNVGPAQILGNTDDRTQYAPGSFKVASFATVNSNFLYSPSVAELVRARTTLGWSLQAQVEGNVFTCDKARGVYGHYGSGSADPQVEIVTKKGQCCAVYVHTVVQACTPFIPWAMQIPAACINYAILIKISARQQSGVVNVLFPGQSDGLSYPGYAQSFVDEFPDYEALVLQPRMGFWWQGTSVKTPAQGLPYPTAVTNSGTANVIASTAHCPCTQ